MRGAADHRQPMRPVRGMPPPVACPFIGSQRGQWRVRHWTSMFLGCVLLHHLFMYTHHHYLFLLKLRISMDIETNPGPKYPCQICNKAVTWKTPGVACDECNEWSHTSCMLMPTAVYEGLGDASWYCTKCGMPQFTSSFLRSLQDASVNTDSSTETSVNSEPEIGSPMASSSPRIPQRIPGHRPWEPMTVLIVNFQSIKNKKAEVNNIIAQYSPAVIIGTETWLNGNILSSEIFPQNYNIFRKDRSDGYGGVLLGIRSDYTSEEISDCNIQTESIYCKIAIDKNNSLVVGSIYRPPNSGMDYMDRLCEEVETVRSRFNKKVVWIGGDFNLPDIDWKLSSIISTSNAISLNQKLLDTMDDIGLEQQVLFPTRNETTLDLYFTNRPSLVNKCTSLPGIGDHDIVLITTSVVANRSKPVRRKIYLWRKADTEKLHQEGELFKTQFIRKYNINSDIPTMWEYLKTCIRKSKKNVSHPKCQLLDSANPGSIERLNRRPDKRREVSKKQDALVRPKTGNATIKKRGK